jgi:uncharacterized DUF497 family protein
MSIGGHVADADAGPSTACMPAAFAVSIYLEYTETVDPEDPLEGCIGFDWDDGNVEKNWELHRVAFWEAEEVFFNEPLVMMADRKHSIAEPRYLTLGQTDSGRLLFISFTVRGSLIRVISARDMTRKEVRRYEQAKA